MTTKTKYVTPDEVRILLGLSDTDISDANTNTIIDFAMDEVDKLTNTRYLVAQDSGTASAGTASTLSDSSKSWTVDEWNSDASLVGGYMVHIYSGTGSGQCRTITDNTATQLTVSPDWSTTPDATSLYRIFENTHETETFDGDGTDSYFTQWYPLLEVQSLTIDSTDITLGGTSLYTYKETGELKLGSTAGKSTFLDTSPQLCVLKYHFGVYPIPNIIKKFTAITAALMIGGHMIGNTYTFATSYTVPEYTINKGVPYPHFEKIVGEMKKQRDFLLTRIQSQINPAIG